MSSPRSAANILEADFLVIRHRLIDVAAAFDRISRGPDSAAIQSDARLSQLQQAAAILTDGQPDRAERVQMVFSLPYHENWRDD
ncbi:MAG: hypothetical protein IID40_06770 [Planctomycetes bacterium]|nr:hypothetical protein [Planctomycetota bacterium]